MAARIEMTFQVVEEKSPLFRPPPPILFTDPVEIDRERGDEIELPAEIGQRLKGADGPNPSLDVKQIE